MSKTELDAILRAQQSAFEGFLKVYFETTNTRIDSVLNQVSKVESAVFALTDRLNELGAKDSDLVEECNELRERTKKLEDQADYLENQSRRNNIRIDGVQETPNESWEATEVKVRDTLATSFGFTTAEAGALHIERAHRTGQRRDSKPRTIVAKLNSYKDREAIIKRARDRKPPGLFIYEDLSSRVLDARRAQLPELKRQREQGKIAYFSLDKLIIRKKTEGT